jgi:hypothetical protein
MTTQSRTELICTVCGHEDCRSGGCNQPGQRRIPREELEAETTSLAATAQKLSLGPERIALARQRESIRKIPVDGNSDAGAAKRRAISALDELWDALTVERLALAKGMTTAELAARDDEVLSQMQGTRRATSETWWQ